MSTSPNSIDFSVGRGSPGSRRVAAGVPDRKPSRVHRRPWLQRRFVLVSTLRRKETCIGHSGGNRKDPRPTRHRRRSRRTVSPLEFSGTIFRLRPRAERMEDRTLLCDVPCDQHGRQRPRLAPPGHPRFQRRHGRDQYHRLRHPGYWSADDRAGLAPAGDHQPGGHRRHDAAGLCQLTVDRHRRPGNRGRRPVDRAARMSRSRGWRSAVTVSRAEAPRPCSPSNRSRSPRPRGAPSPIKSLWLRARTWWRRPRLWAPPRRCRCSTPRATSSCRATACRRRTPSTRSIPTSRPGTYSLQVQGDGGGGLLHADGDGAPAAAPFQPIPVGIDPVAIVAGDFSGDGQLDLAVANAIGDTVSILMGNGDGTFQPPVDLPGRAIPSRSWRGTSPATASSTWPSPTRFSDTVSMLMGNGDGTFQPQVTYAVGAGPDAIVAGDFTGDGHLDLAVANANWHHGVGAVGQRRRDVPTPVTYAVGRTQSPSWRATSPAMAGSTWPSPTRLGDDGVGAAGQRRRDVPAPGHLRGGVGPRRHRGG